MSFTGMCLPLAMQWTYFDEKSQREFVTWSSFDAWMIAGGVWLFLLVCGVMIGRPQTREAYGSNRRLLWVAAFLALMGTLPALVTALFSLLGPVVANQYRVAAFSILINLLCLTAFLLPPVRLRGTKEKLPLVTDESFVQRVARLSQKMGLPVPLVRLLPSVTGAQQALAFVGTLQAPQLVVTDGILNRLKPEECDAIVAHELAHIANGSLFVLASVIPISLAVMTSVADWMPFSLALPFGVAFFVGFRRILNRPIEFDCDARAARVVGFRHAISALGKIHAAHPVSNTGLLSRLMYATATHPSRDARLASLYAKAPFDDRPDAEPDWGLIRNHHRMAIGAASIWGLVMVGTLLLSAWGIFEEWLFIPLLAVGLMPTLLIQLAMKKQIRAVHGRLGQKWSFLSLLGLAAAIAVAFVLFFTVILVLFQELIDEGDVESVDARALNFVIVVAVVVISGLCLWGVSRRKRQKLKHDVAVALQLHNFARARELCVANPKVVQDVPQLRYNQAIAEAVLGNRDVAIGDLQRLWIEKPRFLLTAFALGDLLLDSDQAERAIETIQSVGPKLPKDSGVPLLESRAFRRLGRIDEGRVACDRARKLDPDSGSIHAIAAALELDQGHYDSAKSLITRGLELSPGDPYGLVIRAELAIKTESADQVRIAVEQAALAIRSNPLVFLRAEFSRLESLIPDPISHVAASQL